MGPFKMGNKTGKRVVVAGSRSYTDYNEFSRIMRDYVNFIGSDDLVFISGAAYRGADEMIIRWADENGFDCEQYPANWVEHGRAAGMIRNKIMKDACTHALIFWDCMSKGTKHMIDICSKTPEIIAYTIIVHPTNQKF